MSKSNKRAAWEIQTVAQYFSRQYWEIHLMVQHSLREQPGKYEQRPLSVSLNETIDVKPSSWCQAYSKPKGRENTKVQQCSNPPEGGFRP